MAINRADIGKAQFFEQGAANGFRVADDVRMFDMVSRSWEAAVEPLGTQPVARALTLTVDVAVLPPATVQPLTQAGKLVDGSARPLARVAIGVAVKAAKVRSLADSSSKAKRPMRSSVFDSKLCASSSITILLSNAFVDSVPRPNFMMDARVPPSDNAPPATV